MEFRFVHAADLHIDSPLAGLGLKDPVVADRFARASRAAVEALIDATLQSKAAFLIVAGDVFDGDWKDVGTGLFFAQALGRLHRAGIPTMIVRGNHDADSIMSRHLPYPASVRIFPSDRATTMTLDELRVALHGRSFSSRRTADGFVNSYPARREGWLNIGVLHTGLDGSRGHETYAPCTVDDLRRFGYDYWALGHIHAAEIVSRDPWVVYPGNIQGRSVRETGAKGATLVEVADGRISEATPIVLDGARWAHETIDVSPFDDAPEVLSAIGATLERLRREAGERPLAARLTLTGACAAHALLVARRETIEDEARAIGVAIAGDCWVEKIKIATTPTPALFAPTEADALDIGGLVAAAAQDPEYQAAVAQIVAAIADKMPRDLRGEFRSDDPEALARLAALARDRLAGELAS
jgi:DNA repair protein SbcD/Mre11